MEKNGILRTRPYAGPVKELQTSAGSRRLAKISF
jgi:hypothetical protein